MEQYTVANVSKKLGIHPDTLRYYDKINLVSPKRGENRYRFYNDEDISRLIYAEVLKYANFSLSEIHTILNGSCKDLAACREVSIQLIHKKQNELKEKILHLQDIIEITDATMKAFESIEERGFSILDELCTDIYNKIKKEKI